MIFNSFTFLIFFSLVYIGFYLIPRHYRWVLLLVSSYVFYMWWEPIYIVLIVFSTLVDYVLALQISKSSVPGHRKQLLILSLIINLGLLGVFKYYNFFVDTVEQGVSAFGYELGGFHSSLLLPVGISFYTFQTMSYTIDVYRDRIPAERHLGRFALYVAFFPQLVAGPIERASNLLPQFYERIKGTFSSHQFISGFSQATFGFFKKVVVADTIAIYVNSVYNNYEYHSGWTLLIATYFFAFQIYCDFSGYSDIAIGIARMMGFQFMENFRLPYFCKSVTEFWQRWHISLSSWLKDYLYIPLGGNRMGSLLTYRNLLLTMLLGGLWHGASWNFVLWGMLNGAFLALERLLGLSHFTSKNWLLKGMRIFVTFNLICLTWIFFRSESFSQAMAILSSIFPLGSLADLGIQDIGVFASVLVGLSFLLLIEWFFIRKSGFEELTDRYGIKMSLGNVGLIFLIILFGVSEGSQFIYFQF